LVHINDAFVVKGFFKAELAAAHISEMHKMDALTFPKIADKRRRWARKK